MTDHPQRIGKFEILNRLGEGAMGEVFLARDTLLGREVALKTIRPAVLAVPDAHDRFFREAQATARLNHPNVVTIHEFGEDAGVLYMAMEYVPGDDLVQLIRTRELGLRAMLELLAQVCDGLAFAHQRGVLHRDVKPSNIRITRISGRLAAKVLDFGIARLAGSDLTSTGTLLGTFGYMAPEYIQSGKPDARADIFALGVILYEVLSGERPFGGESTATVLHRIVNEEPAPLDLEALEGISPAILGVVARALAKNPAARYPSADLMAADLRAAKEPGWVPGTDPEATVRSNRSFELPDRGLGQEAFTPSRRAWLYAAVPLLLAALAGGGWLGWRRHKHRMVPVAVQPTPPPVVAPAPPVVQPVAEPAPQETPKPAQEAPKPTLPAPAKVEPAPAKAAPPKPAPASRYATLDQASAALATDPKGTLAYLDQTLKEEPGNERALALRIVALYDGGDYRGCGRAMAEARAAGHLLWPMALKYPRLRKMLEQEKADPRLPRRKAPVSPTEAP